MQMIPCTVPRTTHIANHFALPYPLDRCNGDGGAVGVQGLRPAAVVELYMVPITAAPRVSSVGDGYSTGCRREDERTLWGPRCLFRRDSSSLL